MNAKEQSLTGENAVKETKRIFDGLSEDVDWFKEFADDNKAVINDEGDGFRIKDGDWSADFIPVKGNGKVNLLVHNEYLCFDPFFALLEADAFDEMGILIAELNN